MNWKPITKEELEGLIDRELKECTVNKYIELFNKHRVELFQATLERHGNIENVYIVAKNKNEIMYYEDVEEGFNISPIDKDGEILEYWCNQDKCWVAIQRWDI